MNEKEFELYERGVDKRELVYVQADIARQLTIRNEQERHHAKRLHGIFEAIVEIADGTPTPDVPPAGAPAGVPDGTLVEAVKKAVADLNNVTGSSDDFTQVGLGVVDDLQAALADHVHTDSRETKKAGSDGT